MTDHHDAQQTLPLRSWRHDETRETTRALAEETAVALTYNDLPYAVMMATPRDLQDFALGFTLTEGLAATPEEILSCTEVPQKQGVEMRLVLARPALERLLVRRRRVAGYTGCGLCGLESLDQAIRALPQVGPGVVVQADALRAAFNDLTAAQQLNAATRAVHAAAFWSPRDGLGAVREDVGRHNALDKLAGALARQSLSPASGAVLLTSRISIELVQKSAISGVTLIAAISAPTALAVRAADAAGITLVAIVRTDGFDVFTHPQRIVFTPG